LEKVEKRELTGVSKKNSQKFPKEVLKKGVNINKRLINKGF